ncbi:cAMP-binding domain of CRP or a regulatory subunit of cAMP-dependent protein kinases [Formosa sp. Hel1_31_208]|uniref:response regulator n=1 Tax=Formosa sp. Hel1_31_208 TaxID=1798225 RepID=UPI00087C9A93|nr:response regulator [Formosa sp. Hel1_31_208]SDS17632.1 cAMP-binding domain of CRP or a regulatory subunit of cAMP-dependent protein kinases [Formosa sp. Hel1_31_208]
MRKVLLIEDDQVLRENTAEILELASYKVVTASNGKIGVDKAIKVIPDIIICDIMMPVLDGYSVLEQLAANKMTKHIPFIFLSAKTERQDVRKGMNLGADDYITKPFFEDELISAIESRLAKVSILKEQRESTITQPIKQEDELKTLNDLKNYFDDNGESFSYSKGDVIYSEGQSSSYIYLILKGLVKCYIFDEKGKELTTALHKEDDLFGFTSFTQNIPYQETATALKDTEAVGITKSELRKILDLNHKVTLELIQLLTNDLTGIKDQLLQMAYSSVHKKTAATIVKFAQKMNPRPEDPIKISRSDLASVAGIATETLIRTMTDFKKQGLIEMEGRNIKIVDLESLQHMY